MQWLLVRDFQLHAAVEDIALQSVQADDFLVAAAVAEAAANEGIAGNPLTYEEEAAKAEAFLNEV